MTDGSEHVGELAVELDELVLQVEQEWRCHVDRPASDFAVLAAIVGDAVANLLSDFAWSLWVRSNQFEHLEHGKALAHTEQEKGGQKGEGVMEGSTFQN